MGFSSGSVSFRRFAVVGKHPKAVEQDLLDKISEHALRPGEIGVPEEIEFGWSGGRHVLDGAFGFEENVFADAIHFAMRIDTNKVPGELKKAYAIMEEEAVAATNPSGFISKLQKKDVKETVRQKLEDELRTGKFRRSKLVPILWDLPAGIVYTTAAGKSQELLLELFERTTGLSLTPLSAGSIALRMLSGRRRDYEDLRPTRFVPGPSGEGEYPDYPWVAKGPEPKDFLGNEFLLWLWHQAESKKGVVRTEASGDVSILIDKSLDLDCAYGASGRDSLRATGPHQMPEARDALRSGKVPRRAGMIFEANGHDYTFNFNSETFGCGSTKLPEIEDAETPRVLFEERIALLRDFTQVLDGLFETFLHTRASGKWEGEVSGLRRWILQTAKPVTAVA